MTVTMSGGVNPKDSSQSLMVAPDALTIYEAGNLQQVLIGDLVNNPVAIRMLVNEVNQGKKEVTELRQASVSAATSFVLAVVNAAAVALVAIGGSMLGATKSSLLGVVILIIGAGLSLICSAHSAISALMRFIRAKIGSQSRAALWG